MATAAQMARLEDDSNAIQVGWAAGEGADELNDWLGPYEIDSDTAFRLLGLEDGAPKPFAHYGDVRQSDAVSEYGGGSEAMYWWDLDEGAVLGHGTSGNGWLIPAGAEPPAVIVTHVFEGYTDERQPDTQEDES